MDVVGPAWPGFQCKATNATLLLPSNPSLNLQTGQCLVNGAASTCQDVPPNASSGNRLCACKTSCPQLAPSIGTIIWYNDNGEEAECRAGRCLTGVAAQHSCVPPYVFANQPTVSNV